MCFYYIHFKSLFESSLKRLLKQITHRYDNNNDYDNDNDSGNGNNNGDDDKIIIVVIIIIIIIIIIVVVKEKAILRRRASRLSSCTYKQVPFLLFGFRVCYVTL